MDANGLGLPGLEEEREGRHVGRAAEGWGGHAANSSPGTPFQRERACARFGCSSRQRVTHAYGQSSHHPLPSRVHSCVHTRSPTTPIWLLPISQTLNPLCFTPALPAKPYSHHQLNWHLTFAHLKFTPWKKTRQKSRRLRRSLFPFEKSAWPWLGKREGREDKRTDTVAYLGLFSAIPSQTV